MEFNWDEKKARINALKHGIRFETAALVFNDRNRIEFYDYKHSDTENRYITIGMVNHLITVIYTERHSYTRIISARPATKHEKEIYYGKQYRVF